LLVIKTTRAQVEPLRRALESAHSYEVPEVVAVPVIAGAPNYLAWMEEQLK
jgi:periplasmic divalent cation tolerance protein